MHGNKRYVILQKDFSYITVNDEFRTWYGIKTDHIANIATSNAFNVPTTVQMANLAKLKSAHTKLNMIDHACPEIRNPYKQREN